MIEKIATLLFQKGLVKSPSNLRFNILFTRGTCIVAEVTGSKSESYFIKFSEISTLADEYNLIESAGHLFPHFVPKHFGYFSAEELDLIVVQRVRFKPVQEPIIFHTGHVGLKQQIKHFFAVKRKTLPPPEVNHVHRDLLKRVLGHLQPLGLSGLIEHWMDRAEIENLSGLAQHGDFVHNNLGLAGDRLYVFDWEDFGKVLLPGFDLATVVFADTGFDADKIASIMGMDSHRVSSPTGYIEECCKDASIEYKTLLQLLPLYLAVFYYLKRDYGQEIQSRVLGCLLNLVDINTQKNR